MKKITSYTAHTTAEGQRLTYTVSEIDETTGTVTRSNDRQSIVVLDAEVQAHIDAINTYLAARLGA